MRVICRETVPFFSYVPIYSPVRIPNDSCDAGKGVGSY